MPFTPAHPALVLPLIRNRYLSATALIAGSVAPDFEYFFKMQEDDIHGHTLPGLLYFDLPVVVFLSLIFHLIIKRNFIQNLPRWFQIRFSDVLMFNVLTNLKSRPLFFILSALIGSASHLFWDSFTHANGFFADSLWFYEGTIIHFQGARYPLYYALQHVSSYVGMLIVAVYIALCKPFIPLPVTCRPSLFYWFLILLITGSTVILRFTISPDDKTLGNIVVTIISGLLIAVTLCGFLPARPVSSQTADRN